MSEDARHDRQYFDQRLQELLARAEERLLAEDDRKLARDFHAFVEKHLRDTLDNLKATGALMLDIFSAEQNLNSFTNGLDQFVSKVELAAFIERLMTRQGTTIPDFDALYRRKAELDSKLSGK